MHELAVTESLLELALSHAERAGARRVVGLHLVIGQLASIVDDCVAFYWDVIARGTLAEGAKLHFRRVPARLACQRCGAEYNLDGQDPSCPTCGSLAVRVLAGEEFQLEAIDIEAAEDAAAEQASEGAAP